ncbi:MAG: hypothetical protein ACSHX9_05240 [Luteolibacter sp.]
MVLIAATFAAVYLGIAAATAQLEAALWVVGGITLTICVALGTRIWLLLPFAMSIGLSLPLPGNFSTVFLVHILIIGFSTLQFLTRRLPINFKFTELEGWALLFLICVAQAYFRNPVGLNIFGSDTVGAKPYAVLGMTALIGLLITSLRINPTDLRWWVRITMIASIGNFCLGLLAKFVPAAGMVLGASFSNDVSIDDPADRRVIDQDAASRVSFVRVLTLNLANWISSRISPLKAAFHPIWAPLIIFTLVGGAFSGFRSHLAFIALTYFIGVCYRGGFPQVVISCVIGAVALTVMALTNLIYPFPPNVQRALTTLPGTWEQRYKDDAKQSTEWRTEIWIEALTSEKYIRNKILGDGLGMTSSQLRQIIELKDKHAQGVSGFDYHREAILVNGDYHSGPVQTIRACGYLGLLVLIIGIFRVAVHAHRQILRSRGTEWYPTVLFICNTYLWFPLAWIFVFGSFTGGASGLIIGAALIRLLEKNLPLPPYVKHGSKMIPANRAATRPDSQTA